MPFASIALCSLLCLIPSISPQAPAGASSGYVVNDGHVHITNHIQEGPDIRDFLKGMGTKVGRAVLFGLPLQQMWSYTNTGDYAPTYYLQTDVPLYPTCTRWTTSAGCGPGRRRISNKLIKA